MKTTYFFETFTHSNHFADGSRAKYRKKSESCIRKIQKANAKNNKHDKFFFTEV